MYEYIVKGKGGNISDAFYFTVKIDWSGNIIDFSILVVGTGSKSWSGNNAISRKAFFKKIFTQRRVPW